MPYVRVLSTSRAELAAAAEERWTTLLETKPDLRPAIELQRRLIALVMDLKQTIDGAPFPRLSLPGKYLHAKLSRGVPAIAGEPIPLPVPVLTQSLLKLGRELAGSGGREAAEHIVTAIESGTLDAGSLLAASLARDQDAIRSGAVHRGLSPDLVWLVSELAVGPFVHRLQHTLFVASGRTHSPAESNDPVGAALDDWNHGYCPACGSWPAMAEVVDGHRTLRCSFCAAAWELTSYACIYCGTDGEPFVTAAPNEQRKDRRVEVCSGCGNYLKSVDMASLSPFPVLSVGDLETMDLDVAAMEHGYARPTMRDFRKR